MIPKYQASARSESRYVTRSEAISRLPKSRAFTSDSESLATTSQVFHPASSTSRPGLSMAHSTARTEMRRYHSASSGFSGSHGEPS